MPRIFKIGIGRGVGRDSKPSSEEVALLSKLNIDPSAIMLDKPGEYGTSCRLALPDDPNFTVEVGNSVTTISYKGISVIHIDEKHTRLDVKIKFRVSEKNIKQLEQEDKLPKPDPNIQKNVHEYQKTWDREEEDRSLERDFTNVCSQYINKLESKLKKYAIEQREDKMITSLSDHRVYYNHNMVTNYNNPTDKNPLDLIAWQKLQIVKDAQGELLKTERNPSENIKACLDKLQKPRNVDILKLRRDSWLMTSAKVVSTLGLILIYRALMGDKVTQGIRNASMFAKKYEHLQSSKNKDSEDKDLGAQDAPANMK
ncbi:MAG: hypothetical protein P1U32_08905 [Legionellaceae bacterium]|nr:hypothetical protein [Legionellaceae bacterium]